MKYIVTMRARRKDARNHIAGKFNSLEEARKLIADLKSFPKNTYTYEIYTGNWRFIEEVR